MNCTAEELFKLVARALTSMRGRCGVCPLQSAFDLIPRDPLDTHVWDRLTTPQCDAGEMTVTKIKSKGIALGIMTEEVARAKFERVAQANARDGASVDGVTGAPKYALGDEVDIHEKSPSKDVAGWKGPATIVSLGDPNSSSHEAGVRVAWQGGEKHVPYAQVRTFGGSFWAAEPEKSAMVQISRIIDNGDGLWGRKPTYLGVFRRQDYNVPAKDVLGVKGFLRVYKPLQPVTSNQ